MFKDTEVCCYFHIWFVFFYRLQQYIKFLFLVFIEFCKLKCSLFKKNNSKTQRRFSLQSMNFLCKGLREIFKCLSVTFLIHKNISSYVCPIIG